MKTMIVILLTLALGAGAVLVIRRAMNAPDSHLAPTESAQPIHKLPIPPAAGAQPEVKP